MDRLVLYHNPQCSKSRRALELLRGRDAPVEVIEYLETPPDRAALERVLDGLGDPPTALVRRDERFRALGLEDDACETRGQVVALLLREPALMQRPVALRGRRVVLGRPPERVLELL